MHFLSDPVLFYSGIALTAAALCVLLCALLFFRAKWKKLSRLLDEEYGSSRK